MRRALTAAVVALALTLVLASGAQAAVSLSFSEVQREAATVHRNDEFVGYSVRVENTGTEPTTAPVQVALTLPAGVELGSDSGSGWSCDNQALTCSSSTTVAASAEFSPLKLGLWLLPNAPDAVMVGFAASGGGAVGAPATASDSFNFAPAIPFGMSDLQAGACTAPPSEVKVLSCEQAEAAGAVPFTTAGGHPFAASSSFDMSTRLAPSGQPTVVESLRDLFMDLPAGFLGNPEAVEGICTVGRVRETTSLENLCPSTSVVGGLGVTLPGLPSERMPIYRVVPETGFAAAFAVRPSQEVEVTVVIRVKVRSNGDYGVSAVAPVPPQQPELLDVRFATLCSYGTFLEDQRAPVFAGCRYPGQLGSSPQPFLTNQTKCAGGEPVTKVTIDSYQSPGAQNDEGFPILSDSNWKVEEATSPTITDCADLTQAWVGQGPDPTPPDFQFTPNTTQAAAPAAYSATLTVPQPGLTDRDGVGTAHLKDTTVRLPQGLVLNPSAAHGLAACTEAQIGLVSKSPVRFNTTSEGCPAASKLGTVEVVTPLLDKPLDGAIYLAAQDANPFGSKFALYLVIDDEETGIVAKIAGRVSPDLNTGQITATFRDNPQVPFTDLRVDFFAGQRASLTNPDLCGPYTTRTELTPWSAVDPDAPTAAEIAVSESPVAIGTPPSGRASCPATKAGRPFEPVLRAGATNPLSGAHSPFTLRLTRPEGDQEFASVTVNTPPGLAATLRGLPSCPEAAIAASGSPGHSGAAELASPSCSPSSQVGTTTIGAGSGDSPFYVKTGKVYLTGPYKGAPLGLAFIVPAVAGPFDLGVQVVRTALYVDPKTAQVNAVSDPIPQILEGVPLQIRDIRVDLDRPGFTLNPTSCEAMAINARIGSSSGAVANLQNRFQAAECGRLGFKPKLKLQLHGGTKRAAYQRLEATVTYPQGPGYANLARAAVTLPHSAFLAQEHIRTVCTRVQFAVDACPKGSIYGQATATTPLLDEPLSGPVYLRSSDNLLPDLVVALKGPDSRPIKVELSGRTDSKNEGIRNTFDVLPDAPVSKFTLRMFGGQKSLIVNSRNLCKGPKQRATVRFRAHNGARHDFRPVVGNDCGKGGGKGGKGRGGG